MQTRPVWVVGEALVDMFSTGPVAGGAPFNVARTLAAFGAPVRFVSRIGTDRVGEMLEASAVRYGLRADDLQRDPDHASGVVHVHQQGDQHHFAIASDSAWDYLDGSSALQVLQGERPSVVYFGTLAQRHACSRHAVREMLESTDALRYLDLNLRDGPDNRALTEASLQLADWVKVNEEELALVLKWFGEGTPKPESLEQDQEVPLVTALMRRFSLKRLLVTRGAAGYLCFDSYERSLVRGQSQSVPHLADTVGAGDGFSAMFLAATLQGLPLSEALVLANAYAAAVCAQVGPLPADPAALQPWRQRLQQAAAGRAVPVTT